MALAHYGNRLNGEVLLPTALIKIMDPYAIMGGGKPTPKTCAAR